MSITRFIGIDQSKHSFEVCILADDAGIQRAKYSTKREGIKRFLKSLTNNDVVALETGNNSFRLARLIQGTVNCKVHVLNAGSLHIIFRSLKKTDKEDAINIARFIQRHPEEELPTVSIPSEEEVEMRQLNTRHEQLKKRRTQELNSLGNLLWDNGIPDIHRNGLSTPEKRNAHLSKISEYLQAIAQTLCEVIDVMEQQIAWIEEQIVIKLREHKNRTAISMSMPGVGPIAAFVLQAYLWDMNRFSSPRQVGHYSGFTPTVDCSGETNHLGGINKRGPKHIRRIMTQAAWAALRSKAEGSERYRAFYAEVKSRRGSGRAIVAVARKMLEHQYMMHTRNSMFDEVKDHSALLKKLKRYGIISQKEQKNA